MVRCRGGLFVVQRLAREPIVLFKVFDISCNGVPSHGQKAQLVPTNFQMFALELRKGLLPFKFEHGKPTEIMVPRGGENDEACRSIETKDQRRVFQHLSLVLRCLPDPVLGAAFSNSYRFYEGTY